MNTLKIRWPRRLVTRANINKKINNGTDDQKKRLKINARHLLDPGTADKTKKKKEQREKSRKR